MVGDVYIFNFSITTLGSVCFKRDKKKRERGIERKWEERKHYSCLEQHRREEKERERLNISGFHIIYPSF